MFYKARIIIIMMVSNRWKNYCISDVIRSIGTFSLSSHALIGKLEINFIFNVITT